MVKQTYAGGSDPPAPCLPTCAVLDMGASWVEGTVGNPMTELAEQAGASLFPTPFDGETQARGAAAR